MPDIALRNRIHDLLQNHTILEILPEMERQTLVNATHTTQPGRRNHLLGCATLIGNLHLELKVRCEALEG
jgi:hypothetical protein